MEKSIEKETHEHFWFKNDSKNKKCSQLIQNDELKIKLGCYQIKIKGFTQKLFLMNGMSGLNL